MRELPAVLLDDDGDLWIDLKGTGDYFYLSPYASGMPVKSRDELLEDYPGLKEADWSDA